MLVGKIACANVLSDLYAMGVTECDNMLMLCGVSTKMTEKERDVVMPLMMRGFKVRTTKYLTKCRKGPYEESIVGHGFPLGILDGFLLQPTHPLPGFSKQGVGVALLKSAFHFWLFSKLPPRGIFRVFQVGGPGGGGRPP